MPSTALILETAVLILAAYLIGCVVGHFARRLIMPRQPAASATAAPAERTLPPGPQLVVAPTIAPLPAAPLRRRSAASRLAAAAGRPDPDDVPIVPSVDPPPVRDLVPDPIPPVASVAEVVAEAIPVAVVEPAAPDATREAGPAGDQATIVAAQAPAVEIGSVSSIETAAADAPAGDIPAPEAAPAIEFVDAAVAAPVATPHHRQPTRRAGQATAAALAAGDVPPVLPESPDGPVRAEDVPPIDEATHVVDEPPPELEIAVPLAEPPVPFANAPSLLVADLTPDFPAREPLMPPIAAIPEPTPVPEAAPAPATPAPEPLPPTAALPPSDPQLAEPVATAALSQPAEALPAPAPAFDEDAEAAAMRAIEGGSWRPRRSAAPSRPVDHPDAAAANAAMATARSAVAAATAAAEAAIAQTALVDAAPVAPDGASFEHASAEAPQPFLDAEPAPPPPEAAPDLMFEAPRAASRHGFGRPPGLESPRDGAKDNLKRISGITPVLESSLNGLGIYHFDQIAAWDQKEVTWVEAHLSLRGRIGKEKWLEQARDLSAGRARPARPVRR